MRKEKSEYNLEIKNDYLWAIGCSTVAFLWCAVFMLIVIAFIVVAIKFWIYLWDSFSF